MSRLGNSTMCGKLVAIFWVREMITRLGSFSEPKNQKLYTRAHAINASEQLILSTLQLKFHEAREAILQMRALVGNNLRRPRRGRERNADGTEAVTMPKR